MRTVKWNPFLSGVAMLLGGVLLWAGAAHADISSTNPAAIVVFPKIVVDTGAVISDAKIDTVIQLTNTAPQAVNVRCFYVDANGHCSNAPTAFCDPGQPASDYCSSPGYCIPGWVETDFSFQLTANQPLVWTVSAGLAGGDFPLASLPGIGGELNTGSIPQAAEDPMLGELKCVEVGDDEMPVDTNDLKGEATIELLTGVNIDIEGYNAVGIQAIPGSCSGDSSISCTADTDCQPPATSADDTPCIHVNNFDNTLVIGGPNAEYNGCPNTLILDHFFDDAPVLGSNVDTWLTLVPCSEDFFTQTCVTTTVQYLVYNEFEQRFSTSRPLTCFSELQLSDIDTRLGNDPPNNYTSIFNVNVEGTLTGQTVIRGVADSDPTITPGHGLLGVVHEFHQLNGGSAPVFSAAYMLDLSGSRTQADIVLMPPPSPQ
ncbi:MAG: hypothetical protein ABSA52_04310 [Candidatus Binatia bacterium]|jgi:hypothetical protein